MVQASDTGMKKQYPVIALIGIFDKHNEPVIMRNYLYDFLRKEHQERIERAESALQGADQEIEKIKAVSSSDLDLIEM